MRSLFLGLAALALATPALARPITYPGGGMGMLEYADESWTAEAFYTPRRWASVGVHSEFDGEDDRQFQGVMASILAHRTNAADAQGNVYVTGVVGAASQDRASLGRDTGAAASALVEADWENRRLFVLGQARGFAADGIDRTMSYRGRVGVAPYVAEYGDLHTWLMLQVDHKPEADEPVTVTPLVRLFKGPVLIEAGASLKGDGFANLMIYF